MSSLTAKLVQCFFRAKQVIHFYFVHTDGDDAMQRTSIENVQRIVERLTQLPVEKYRATFEASSLRGNIERYDDRFVIHVRAGQTSDWERFTVIKELCHALMDDADEWSPDGVKTIQEYSKYQGFSVDWSSAPEVARSERIAELMALELIYPFEYRAGDKGKVADGVSLGAIAEKRGVPRVWVERALQDEHLESCTEIWAVVPEVTGPLPPPLAHHK